MVNICGGKKTFNLDIKDKPTKVTTMVAIQLSLGIV